MIKIFNIRNLEINIECKDQQLKNHIITLYTHNPLTGITNTISPNGIKATYEYDDYSRLIKVKNASSQVIKENKYNFKQ